MRTQPVVASITDRGGGDKPPVLALASALSARDHRVSVFCDGDVAELMAQTELPSVQLPLEQSTVIRSICCAWSNGERVQPKTPDPLQTWAHSCLPHALAAVAPFQPAVLPSTMFSMRLAEMLAARLSIPWNSLIQAVTSEATHAVKAPTSAFFGPRTQEGREEFRPLFRGCDLSPGPRSGAAG
jgi:hypothetical protein